MSRDITPNAKLELITVLQSRQIALYERLDRISNCMSKKLEFLDNKLVRLQTNISVLDTTVNNLCLHNLEPSMDPWTVSNLNF